MSRSLSYRRTGVEETPPCPSPGRDRFAGVGVPLILLLETAEAPAALWTAEGSARVHNDAAARLFGAASDAVLQDRASWCARIHGADRARFLEFCESATARGGRSQCLYRFTPPGREDSVELLETAQVLDLPAGDRVVFSRYTAEPACRRAAHAIGNHLQAVHGELDLLRLSGRLPEAAAIAVLRPLDAVHELLRQIGKPHS